MMMLSSVSSAQIRTTAQDAIHSSSWIQSKEFVSLAMGKTVQIVITNRAYVSLALMDSILTKKITHVKFVLRHVLSARQKVFVFLARMGSILTWKIAHASPALGHVCYVNQLTLAINVLKTKAMYKVMEMEGVSV